jgi:hypothetical protein
MRTARMLKQSGMAKLFFCDICSRRIANRKIAGSSTKLCSDCEKLTAIHHSGIPAPRTPYEKHFWIVMTALGLSFVLLAVALILPARSSRQSAVLDEKTAHKSQSAVAVASPAPAISQATMAKVEMPHAAAANVEPKRSPVLDSKVLATQPSKSAPAPVADLTNTPKPANRAAPDDVPPVAKTPQNSAPTAASTPVPTPSAPTTAASAASAGPVAKDAGPAEASKAADPISLDLERAKAFTRLLSGDAAGAHRVFEALRPSAPADLLASIDDDVSAVEFADRALKAVPEGIKRIDTSRTFVLRLIDGKSVSLAADCTVASVKDDQFEVEQKFGDATASQRISIKQLAPQTRYELAALGLPAAPASDFSLAATAYAFTVCDVYQVPAADFLVRIENAKKDQALAERAARLQQRYMETVTERARSAAMRKITAAINANSMTQAKALLRDFKRDFATADAPASVQEFIDKATFDVADLKQGLWASYYAGEEENPLHKYLFSREMTKLDYSWGAGSPDPKVPNDCFGIRVRGILHVTTPGTYVFSAVADDFLELTIDGKHVLTSVWTTDGENGKSGSIRLTTGDHELKITYKEIFVNAMMRVRWKTDGGTKFEDIPEASLWYDPKLVDKYQKDLN